ncbi:MAG: hypothetical protein H6819_04025 [Phycisphaerales bacterium]|nr:hypothetical protein [Phycisphaerales bacterium]MCB9856367.1 hypothetical protein [Phycisphaerales bacterium]MCB9864039.1 hypothetical protein [Phycisphaerales bacterium]
MNHGAGLSFRSALALLPTMWFLLVNHWPGKLGCQLRYRYYKRRLKHLGERAVLDVGVHFVNPQCISIGDNTHIDRHVTIAAGPIHERNRVVTRKQNPHFTHETGEVHIGSDVHIAPLAYLLGHGGICIGNQCGVASGACLLSVSHHHRDASAPNSTRRFIFSTRVPDEDQSLIIGPVVMHDRTGLGIHSIAFPGSTISSDSWVGAQSIVMGTIPKNVIAGGNPATILRERPE